MNCRDVEKLLAEGGPLSREAEKHVSECAGCRTLMEALDVAAEGNAPALGNIAANVLPGMTRVKPLPRDGVLILLSAGVFVVFSLLIAWVVGMYGFAHLTPLQRVIYYGVVGLFGLLFSMTAVQAAIPGAKVRIGRGHVLAASVVGVAIVVLGMFANFRLDHFVAQGVPCLRLGCLCAAIFGVLAAIVLLRGYVTDIRATAVLIGGFAGFSGVAVLSLHCPLQNALHIIVWHLGAVALSLLVGLAVGSMVQRKAGNDAGVRP